MTVRELQSSFLLHGRVERHYAAQTLAKMRDCFRAWILPCLGEQELGNLSYEDVIKLRAAMVNGKLGINRQYQILMVLKLLLKFARQVLRISCLDPNEIRLPVKPKPHVVFLNNDEVNRLQHAVRTDTFTGLRMRTLVEVLLGTGLRISEALALNRRTFEIGQTQIEILGKGGKRRTVFFPENTVQWIKKFLYYRVDDCPALFVTTGSARRLDRYDISRYFRALRRDAGIDKPVTPHILRHTYCTNLLHNGADITFIRDLAGHSEIQTTAKYYLGTDHRTLKGVVDRFLNYESPPAESPRSSDTGLTEAGGGASILPH